jgi:hypothetical protein
MSVNSVLKFEKPNDTGAELIVIGDLTDELGAPPPDIVAMLKTLGSSSPLDTLILMVIVRVAPRGTSLSYLHDSKLS